MVSLTSKMGKVRPRSQANQDICPQTGVSLCLGTGVGRAAPGMQPHHPGSHLCAGQWDESVQSQERSPQAVMGEGSSEKHSGRGRGQPR